MTREEFTSLALSKYDAIHSLNNKHKENFYDYEKEFVALWRELGGMILEKNISKVPKDRRKKKLY